MRRLASPGEQLRRRRARIVMWTMLAGLGIMVAIEAARVLGGAS